MSTSLVSGQSVLGYSGLIEGKEASAPFLAATKKVNEVALPPSGFLADLFREEDNLCHPFEVDGTVTEIQLKLIGEQALASQKKTEALWDFIMRSKIPETYSEKIGCVASRAITALNLARFSFSGKDLSGVHVPGANLSGGIFYKTNFTGANLQGVQFQHANLGGASVQGADLRGIDFGQLQLKAPNTPCKNACSLTVQGPLVAIGEVWDHKSRGRFHQALVKSLTIPMESREAQDHLTRILDELRPKAKAPPGIHIWSLSNGRAEHVYSWIQKEGVGSLASTKDCTRLASVGKEGNVTVWNPKNGTMLYQLPCKEIGWCDISQSLERPMIACTSLSGTISLFNLIDAQLEDFIPQEVATGQVLFMPDGIHLLIPTKDGIKLFDTRIKQTTKIWTAPPPWNQFINPEEVHRSAYDEITLSADGKWIAVVGYKGVVIWSSEQTEPIKLLGHSAEASGTAITFSSNGQLLAI